MRAAATTATRDTWPGSSVTSTSAASTAAFKEAYERIAGKPWSRGREQTALERPSIDRAFAEVNGEASEGIIKQYSASPTPSRSRTSPRT